MSNLINADNAITNTLEQIFNEAKQNMTINENDYTENGILYCGNCNTPKQVKIELCSKIFTPYALCTCMQAEYEKKQKYIENLKKQEQIADVRRNGIHKSFYDCTFENDKGYNPRMIELCMKYVASWNENYKNNIGLLFWGNTGIGKTYCAMCIANYLIDLGYNVYTTTINRLINDLSGFMIEDKNHYINSLNKYDLLIIDDLGIERQTEYASEIIYNIINERYINGKPLIITTNLLLDEINNPKNLASKRIYGRITEMCTPILFDGKNIRQEIANEKIKQAKKMFG